MLWKYLYLALQLIAYLLPFLQKGKGVDMRPVADVERMRDLRKEMARMNDREITQSGTQSNRKFR